MRPVSRKSKRSNRSRATCSAALSTVRPKASCWTPSRRSLHRERNWPRFAKCWTLSQKRKDVPDDRCTDPVLAAVGGTAWLDPRPLSLAGLVDRRSLCCHPPMPATHVESACALSSGMRDARGHDGGSAHYV